MANEYQLKYTGQEIDAKLDQVDNISNLISAGDGERAVVLGAGTASGIHAQAFGGASVASGGCSHAWGYRSIASGDYSHAGGRQSQAIGSTSHAEGFGSKASGDYSHAEGEHAEASGDYSHAEGRRTIASGDYQTVIGKYNVEDTSKAFIIGNGDSETNRSNAFTIDWDGNIVAANYPAYISADEGKILQINNGKPTWIEPKTETWTFTLADGSTITKKVHLE